MRDVSHPALTASPGSANPVLHRFCHPTLFVGQMGRSQAVRRHVLKARGSLLSTLLTKHTSPLGPTTRHVTRTKIKALWEQGMTQRAIAKSVGCGIATVARWVHKFKEAKHAGIPDNIAVVDEPPCWSPNQAHQLDWQSNREIHGEQAQPTAFCNPYACSTEIWCCTHTHENRTISLSTRIEAVSSPETTSPPSSTKEEACQIREKTFES